MTLVSNTFGGIVFPSFLVLFSFIDGDSLYNLLILNKSSLLFKAIFIPKYPKNPYVINVKIPPTIGIEFIKPPNKYAITNPIIRPIEPNNISV